MTDANCAGNMLHNLYEYEEQLKCDPSGSDSRDIGDSAGPLSVMLCVFHTLLKITLSNSLSNP